jgi:outer membrane protein TolC
MNNLINELKFAVKQSYLSLLLQTKLLDISRENLKIYEDFLFVAQKNYDAGASTNLEVLGAKVNKIKFENEVKNLETQIRIIQSELKKLMNVDYNIIPSEELTYKEHLVIKEDLLKMHY